MEARLTDIPVNEVLRYLGHDRQAIDGRLDRQIASCIDAVMKSSRPRLTYRILDIHDGMPDGLNLRGNDIKMMLYPCNQAIVMAATLGPEAEDLLRRTEVLDMADAVIMDSAQSTAIENVCDNFEFDMRSGYKAQGLWLTDRFSPGYGDMPLEDQKEIIALLSAGKRIGLTLTPGNIMVPRKSVTCIIGIAAEKQKLVRRGCGTCTLNGSCAYRKGGSHCD